MTLHDEGNGDRPITSGSAVMKLGGLNEKSAYDGSVVSRRPSPWVSRSVARSSRATVRSLT